MDLDKELENPWFEGDCPLILDAAQEINDAFDKQRYNEDIRFQVAAILLLEYVEILNQQELIEFCLLLKNRWVEENEYTSNGENASGK